MPVRHVDLPKLTTAELNKLLLIEGVPGRACLQSKDRKVIGLLPYIPLSQEGEQFATERLQMRYDRL